MKRKREYKESLKVFISQHVSKKRTILTNLSREIYKCLNYQSEPPTEFANFETHRKKDSAWITNKLTINIFQNVTNFIGALGPKYFPEKIEFFKNSPKQAHISEDDKRKVFTLYAGPPWVSPFNLTNARTGWKNIGMSKS